MERGFDQEELEDTLSRCIDAFTTCCVTIGLVFGLTSCAGSARWLRSEPSTHFPTQATLTLPDSLKGKIFLHCLSEDKIKYLDAKATAHECRYISADVSATTENATSPDDTKAVTTFLIAVSDVNCSTFLQRVFASKASRSLLSGTLQDVTTGASGAAAFSSAGIAAGLAGANLIVGKTFQNIDKTYFLEQTFQAIEAAIQAERLKARAYISARLGDTSSPLSMVEALATIRDYDDACSIKAGLNRLTQEAEFAKSKAQQGKITVEAAPTLATFKAEFAPVPKP